MSRLAAANPGVVVFLLLTPSPSSSAAKINIAPPGQEGWTRHQEKYREASLMERTGWWVHFFLILSNHPVPGQEGQC